MFWGTFSYLRLQSYLYRLWPPAALTQSEVQNMVAYLHIPPARTRLFSAFTAAFGPLKLKEEEEQKKAKVKEVVSIWSPRSIISIS